LLGKEVRKLIFYDRNRVVKDYHVGDKLTYQGSPAEIVGVQTNSVLVRTQNGEKTIHTSDLDDSLNF